MSLLFARFTSCQDSCPGLLWAYHQLFYLSSLTAFEDADVRFTSVLELLSDMIFSSWHAGECAYILMLTWMRESRIYHPMAKTIFHSIILRNISMLCIIKCRIRCISFSNALVLVLTTEQTNHCITKMPYVSVVILHQFSLIGSFWGAEWVLCCRR